MFKAGLKRIPFLTQAVRLTRHRRQLSECKAALARYCAENSIRKLQIGAANNVLPGWFNVDLNPHIYKKLGDVQFLEATRPFPFADRTFGYVFSEHMIEHIGYLEGRVMLAECYRVMQAGGRIRIATPDLKKLATLYQEPLTASQEAYVDAVFKRWRFDYESREVGIAINNIFGFGHRFIYDRNTLGEILEKAGFVNVVQYTPGQSDDEALMGIDAHRFDDDYIKFETLVLEAEKPASKIALV